MDEFNKHESIQDSANFVSLEDEIKFYSESLPYWAKYLSAKLFSMNGVTDEDIDQAFTFLLEDIGLKEKTNRIELTINYRNMDSKIYNYDLYLTKLHNVQGVNALVENQIIEFSPKVTIIYGINGSGKSSYIRLLKKAFFSRAEEALINNVHGTIAQKDVKADFEFLTSDKTHQLQYPNDSTKPEFSQFTVFDGKSVMKHLDNKNEFEFRPAALNFFAGLTNTYRRVEQKLFSEITTKSAPMDYSSLFDGESDIKSLLIDITSKTKIEQLKIHLNYSEMDREYKKELEEQKAQLITLKKDKEISIFNEIKILITEAMEIINENNKYFIKEYFLKIELAIVECKSKEELSQKSGIDYFKSDLINQIGSREWKNFIQSAHKFSELQREEYPCEGDKCLLCHQILSQEAILLITNCWSYIRSQVEKESKDSLAILEKEKTTLLELNFDLFPEKNILTKWLSTQYSEELSILNEALLVQKKLSKNIISDLENKTVSVREHNQIDDTPLRNIISAIDNNIKELKEKEPTIELAKISKLITYLEHKEKLEQHIDKIEIYINNLKWAATATSAKRQLLTRNITEKEKELSGKYFNQAYIDTFNSECQKLNGNFGIEINHTGTSGTSFRQLKLKNYSPSEILSEGEQRVVSLADFLSEIQLSNINRGIIFDDPVNSLDEERKCKIAERLVDEGNKRQVIIFTHDLVFVSSIITACKDFGIEQKCHWIEKNEGIPGTIWLENTPSFEKLYKTTKKVQDYYDEAKKLGPEYRENQIKNGFAALRTSYESLVVFDLFEGVVQRFTERVSVDSLSKVIFDMDIRNEIMNGFGICCSYMEGHLHSDKFAYKKPVLENLNEEILRFNVIKKRLKDLKKYAV
jgi:recombinational DNA repair ATPase RecF